MEQIILLLKTLVLNYLERRLIAEINKLQNKLDKKTAKLESWQNPDNGL